MSSPAKLYLVLDSNIWVGERMLYTAIGSATLHTLTRARGVIGLPEVVEAEVSRVMLDRVENDVATIQKALPFLRQLSQQPMNLIGPTPDALKAGIEARWKALAGLIERSSFTLELARSALERVMAHAPPSGPNNEQYRDCLIWQASLDLAAVCPVHLVTNDHAFYEGGNRQSGLASTLEEEARNAGRDIRIYPNLTAFLGSIDRAVARVDEKAIAAAIVEEIRPKARQIASRDAEEELGAAQRTEIIGYATPKPSVVAVSFSVEFGLNKIEVGGGQEVRIEGDLTLFGSCSYDPITGTASDIEIRQWINSVKGGGRSVGHTDPRLLSQQFGPGNIRLL